MLTCARTSCSRHHNCREQFSPFLLQLIDAQKMIPHAIATKSTENYTAIAPRTFTTNTHTRATQINETLFPHFLFFVFPLLALLNVDFFFLFQLQSSANLIWFRGFTDVLNILYAIQYGGRCAWANLSVRPLWITMRCACETAHTNFQTKFNVRFEQQFDCIFSAYFCCCFFSLSLILLFYWSNIVRCWVFVLHVHTHILVGDWCA